MDRRLLLAVALSSAVMFTYPLLLARMYPNVYKQVTLSTNPARATDTVLTQQTLTVPTEALPPPVTYQFSGSKLSVVYSDRSGGIQQLTLPNYHNLNTGQPVTLLDTNEPSQQLFSLSISGTDGAALPLVPLYQARYTDDGAEFSSSLSTGAQITKSFQISHNSPVIACSLRVSNPTQRPIDFNAQAGLALHAANGSVKTSYTAPMEAILTTQDHLIKITQPSVAKHPKHRVEHPYQIALLDRHFCFISTVPLADGATAYSTTDKYGMGVYMPLSRRIAPGTTEEFRWALYAGPRDYQQVKAIGQGFEESLRLGILGHIGLGLLAALKAINALVHNYGIAIILLTVLVSALLAPFNLMSLKSMQRMKALQPLADALRVKYKENQEKFNKEYMALMKKHRVNPLAGCLVPLVIQMPIFFALLRVLSNSIELRGASFLWIKDLSAPDHLAKLPFTLPFFGDELNLLPLLTIVAMFLQQRTSQGSMGAANTQGMPDMSLIMLIMFGIWMYHAPSGPVLYWLVNTSIMVVWFKMVNLRPVTLEP